MCKNEETDYSRINLYDVPLKLCDELQIGYKKPGKR